MLIVTYIQTAKTNIFVWDVSQSSNIHLSVVHVYASTIFHELTLSLQLET